MKKIEVYVEDVEHYSFKLNTNEQGASIPMKGVIKANAALCKVIVKSWPPGRRFEAILNKPTMKQINFQIEDTLYTEYKTVLFNENKTIAKDLRDYIQQRIKEF